MDHRPAVQDIVVNRNTHPPIIHYRRTFLITTQWYCSLKIQAEPNVLSQKAKVALFTHYNNRWPKQLFNGSVWVPTHAKATSLTWFVSLNLNGNIKTAFLFIDVAYERVGHDKLIQTMNQRYRLNITQIIGPQIWVWIGHVNIYTEDMSDRRPTYHPGPIRKRHSHWKLYFQYSGRLQKSTGLDSYWNDALTIRTNKSQALLMKDRRKTTFLVKQEITLFDRPVPWNRAVQQLESRSMHMSKQR